ncbi:MAG: GNAT family N-acetyltransferase [Streptosporangiaceae bacterium]
MVRQISFALKPTITGDLVTLRPVSADDAADLAGVSTETLRLTGTHSGPFSLDELRAWYGSRAEHADRLDLAVVERSTGRWAGEIVLMNLDPVNRSCGFRILLAGPEWFGRGLGTEATRLVLGHAFDLVGVHRVELTVYAFNPRARHVYRKIGFVSEGIKRQALLWDGEWVDAELMSMLAPEWASHRGTPGAAEGIGPDA